MLRIALAFVIVAGTLGFMHTGANACILEPCDSSWELHASILPAPLFVCPQGDTPSFLDQGWWISITVLDCSGSPVPGIPASDFWLIDVGQDDIALCGGVAAVNADSMTNSAGQTTMSLTNFVGGGCVDGLAVVVQGFVLTTQPDCAVWKIEPIHLRSPDIDASLTVDIVDLSLFAAHFPPNAYAVCCDMNDDGIVNLVDLGTFAPHFGPPGHRCN